MHRRRSRDVTLAGRTGRAPGQGWAPDLLDAILLATATLLVVAPVVPAAAATRPPVFAGSAGAAAVHAIVDTEPSVVPIATLLEVRATEASSTFESSGTIEARASSLWPGRSGTGGPQLLCDFGAPCPEGFPPDYPLTAEAAHPSRPEASTPTGFARAQASPDGVASSARPGNVLGPDHPLSAALTVGAAASRTTQGFVDGLLVVRSETTIEDVVLADGQLTVESIVARATARAGVGDDRSASAELTIAGVRTAGGAVLVGEDGVTVGGEGTDGAALDQLNAALQEALAGTPVSVVVLGAEHGTSDGTVVATVHGVQLSMAQGLDGPPAPQLDRVYRTYVVHATLAQARSAARAAEDPFVLGSDVAGGLDERAAGPSAGAGAEGGSAGSAGGAPTARTARPPGATGRGLASGDDVSGPAAPSLAPGGGPGGTGDTDGAPPGWTLLGGPAAGAARTGYAVVAAAVTGVLVLSRGMGRRLAGPEADAVRGGR